MSLIQAWFFLVNKVFLEGKRRGNSVGRDTYTCVYTRDNSLFFYSFENKISLFDRSFVLSHFFLFFPFSYFFSNKNISFSLELSPVSLSATSYITVTRTFFFVFCCFSKIVLKVSQSSRCVCYYFALSSFSLATTAASKSTSTAAASLFTASSP